MQSNGTRVLVALAAVAVVVVAFFVLSGDEEAGDGSGSDTAETTQATTDRAATADDDAGNDDSAGAEPEPDVETIVLRDGEPQGGVAELAFDKGEEVRLRLESNVDDEVHVHGYDIEQAIAAGESTEIEFPAEIDGIFEIESHDFGTQIAELTVNP